ncbi:MAG: hypothetical protein QOJ12_412, partial [Thermoleophilales bacterium]|nr:hypothetical protein [Thermoleophilales bacterium]
MPALIARLMTAAVLAFATLGALAPAALAEPL